MTSSLTGLHAQLRRMRALNFRYHALFFRYINLWMALIVGLLVASLLEPLRLVVLLVPHLILYAAMQGAFHFHYIIFARRYARALEASINDAVGQQQLIASELEAAYFFPLDAPRFVGFSFGAPTSFFSLITLHYGIAGTLLWALTLYRAAQLAPTLATHFTPLAFYVPLTVLWTLLNMGFLGWYFLRRRDEQVIERRLQQFLHTLKHASA